MAANGCRKRGDHARQPGFHLRLLGNDRGINVASRTPAERIHRARVELPVSTQPLALRVDAAASLHSTPIADLRVLTVPRLDALPRAMRRAVR